MLYKKDDNVSFSSFRRLALSVTNSNSLHYITIQFLIAGVLGILFGTIWGGPLWLVGFLVFVPVIWFKLNTYESTIYIFSYYLFSLKPLPVLFSRYNNPFSKENFSFAFIPLWIVYAILLSVPWVIVKTILSKVRKDWLVLVCVPIIIGVIPPFYILGLASPIESCGILFPGTGFIGIFFYFVLIASLCSIKRNSVRERLLYILIPALLFSAYLNIGLKSLVLPKDWVAVSTKFSPLASKSENQRRYYFLITSIKSLVDNGYHVLVFPENAIGLWSRKTKKLWMPLVNYAKNNGVTVLSGAYIHDVSVRDDKLDGGIVAIGKKNGVVYLTRQPVPIAEWIPFDSKGERVHWFSRGTSYVNKQKVAFTVCYEELLPGIILSSFLSFVEPNLIISVANNWMGEGTEEWRAQLSSISVMSRLFGVPLLRSWNRQ
jgi:hypothetical protein